LEIPLKIILYNFEYKIIPINWYNRKYGVAKFKIKELGSQYLFTLFYVLIKKVLKKYSI
jgi:dolichol-phosphate mannosyltransferase